MKKKNGVAKSGNWWTEGDKGYYADDLKWMDSGTWVDYPREFSMIDWKWNLQKFREDAFSLSFFDTLIAPELFTLNSLTDMRDNLISSPYFGEIIYDNNLMEISRFFTREFFIRNYPAIIKSLRVAGTFECYEMIIRSAIGATDVTFTVPNPAHLIITVGLGVIDGDLLIQEDFSQSFALVESYGEYKIKVNDSVRDISLGQLDKLIDLLNVSGVYIEIGYSTLRKDK